MEQNKHQEKGILIQDDQTDAPSRGIVAAKGDHPNCDDLSVGDEVLFAQYSADSVQLGGENYYCVREDSIHAILSTN